MDKAGIETKSELEIITQAGLTLDNDQGADTPSCHVNGGAYNFVDVMGCYIIGSVKGGFAHLG